jgi:hypothetical protein
VTVYVPAEPVQERSDVPEVPRVTLVGVRVQDNPVEGDTDDIRLTVPVNPLIDVTVIVEVPEAPAVTATPVGLADTEKSGTATL